MLAGNPVFVAGSFESIATVSVGAGGSSTISFTSIPSTYNHLQIRAVARGNNGDVYDSALIRVNSDSGSNYTFHQLAGDGSSASAGAVTPYSGFRAPEITGANATSGIFGAFVCDISDYTNTNKYKTARILGGDDRNGAGQIALTSGVWMNGNAITNITIIPVFGSLFAQNSHFALYGIKGAA